jgi:hypothetical protein
MLLAFVQGILVMSGPLTVLVASLAIGSMGKMHGAFGTWGYTTILR